MRRACCAVKPCRMRVMPLQAIIDRAALRSNLHTLRQSAPYARIMAVVKANAYGHGIVPAVEALAEADGFAVARLEEAIALDDHALTKRPILLLEGVASQDALREALHRGFHLVVHHFEQLQWLADDAMPALLAGRQGRARAEICSLNLWLKFDTGMNRLGFPTSEVLRVIEAVKRLRAQWSGYGVSLSLCLMSHFACADEPSRIENATQEADFALLRTRWHNEYEPIEASFCNSAALLTRPAAQFHWARPGISLYGVSPFADRSAEALGLQPVMTLHTEVIAMRALQVGERVGYGATWQAQRPSRIAILAAGYADGLPRHLPSGAPVLVAGERAVVAGRVSMDMLAVDVTDIPAAGLGSAAVLWGRGLPVEEVATAAGTIAYELLCALNARVPVKIL